MSSEISSMKNGGGGAWGCGMDFVTIGRTRSHVAESDQRESRGLGLEQLKPTCVFGDEL